MKHAILILSVAGLLTACNSPAPEETPAPAPAAETAPPTPAATPAATTYACTPTMSLAVIYDNASGPDGQARVTLDGKEYVLNHVQSGSGARYETDAGRTAGATLIWWNQGNEGLLLEGSTANPDAEETTLATCTQTPAP